jgi:hypothetical protein
LSWKAASIDSGLAENAPIFVLVDHGGAQAHRRVTESCSIAQRSRTTLIRILVVNDGKILEQEQRRELMANDGLHASLYRQQMEIAHHETAHSSRGRVNIKS